MLPENKNDVLSILSGGGEMGKLIRAKDWSKTPLGSPDTWPQILRTAVSLCIGSNFPICISWGPHRVQIYNDGYWPITGDMHPFSMGQDFKECWQSAWPVIGQAFEEASLGETRFLENQRIFLERYGYTEETFFTFSFSPILDESGGVGGLFHPVIEQTQQTLAERRLNILHNIPDHTVNAETTAEASALVAECLKDFSLDIPFLLVYSISDDGKEAAIEGSVGVEPGSPLSPVQIDLEAPHPHTWPFMEVVQNKKAVQVDELGKIFGTFTCGPYPESPNQALIFPITLTGNTHNNYLLVAGVSSRRSLDEKYRLFYALLAEATKNALAKARAYQEERNKAEALAEIDKAKTAFFSNVSHEFRTPLTLMLGSLEEMLKNGKRESNDKEALQTTHRNALRLLRLVNNLLDFSSIEAGKTRMQYRLTDIAEYTSDLASNFRSIIENAGLRFHIKSDTIIQPVYVDKEMWEKIVLNLLSNAFKYTLEGGIELSLTTQNNHVVLTVKDTGVGIPENELPKMFRRFHRVQNVTGRTYEGTGIGLSLVKELVNLHGGEIRVSSKMGKGTAFTVSIPTGKTHLPKESVVEKEVDFTASLSDAFLEEAASLIEQPFSNNGNGEHGVAKNSPTVLIVDDNADMRTYIKSLLQKQYNVVTANNGMDALHKIKSDSPDLVLSDVMMPIMDGIQLVKEVKENQATAQIPVILLSARAGEEAKIEGYDIGADDYLVKPFSAKELLARVASQIKLVALRRSTETNVRNLFMQAPAVICVLRGPQHVYELANEMYLQLVGNRDVLGKPIREALPELEGQGFYELLDNVYLTGEPFIGNELPVKVVTGNGGLEEIYMNVVYQPARNSEGEVDGIMVHGVDITEQVLARKRIEESENRFRTMADASPMLIWTLDANGLSSYYNQTVLDFIGVSKEEDISDWEKIVHPDDLKSTFDTINTAITERRPYSLECRLLRADGQWRSVLAQGNPRTGAKNEFLGFVGSSVDITERKNVQDALILATEKQEQTLSFLESLLENAPVGFAFFDKEHRYLRVNDTLAQINGIAAADHIGKSICEILPVTGVQVIPILEKVMQTGEPILDLEVTGETPKQPGIIRNWLTGFYPVTNVNTGNVDSVGAVVTEITERVKAEGKLVESEAKFRHLIQSNIIGVLFWDMDGGIRDANDEFLAMLGYTRADLEKGLDWRAMTPENWNEADAEGLRQVLETGSHRPFEKQYLHKDGHPVDVIIGSSAFENSGNHQGVTFVLDITARKRAEQAIHDSEARFRTLANDTPAFLFTADEETNLDFVNRRWLEFVGLTEKEGFGKSWEEVTHPDDIAPMYAIYSDAVKHKKPYRFEIRQKNTAGEYRWVLWNGIPRTNERGELAGIVGIGIDITEQKRVQEIVQESEERFRQLADSMPQIVWTSGPDGCLDYYNKRWYEFTGFEEGYGDQSWIPVLHPDDVQLCVDTWYHSVQGGEPYQIEYRFKDRLTGTYKWFLGKALPVRDAEGRITKWFGSCTDIHEQKIKEERKDEFISLASHEMKTPLTTAKAYLQFLERSLVDSEGNGVVFAKKASRSINRLSELVSQLLDVSKIQLGKLNYSITTFNFNDMVDSTVESMQLITSTHSIIKTGTVSGDVIGDKDRLQQVIINLITNAVKYSPGAERVLVNVEQENSMIKVLVIDNGIGIAKESLNKIFDKYHRVEEHALRFQGLGIGLFISYEIIQRHNGKLWVESELGKGSTFIFTLPVAYVEAGNQNY